ncbi:MAG: YkgJ family cysteine cluster protein [Phycisphaera sp.]|nr:YkgJ family cysteine cluster protein [Phycisphaera sp.]
MSKEEWYADGLSFECTQCGNCCTGPSGYVWFDDAELKAMAEHFGMTPKEFRKTYAHKVHGDWSLNETLTQHGYDCVFLRRDEQGKALCSIYNVRPKQCRTWPFWPENLRSLRAWANAAQRCPGMMKGLQGEGVFVPIEEIRIRRDATNK